MIEVENLSPLLWDQGRHGAISVGNHWLSIDNTMLIQDDARGALPHTLAPGGKAALTLSLRAPSNPGRYVCEFDVVHEGVTWFGDRSSTTLRLPVTVGDAANPSVDGGREYVPPDLEYPELALMPVSVEEEAIGDFPMYGIPSERVLSLMASVGAECIQMEPEERGGPEWVSFKYFVRKL